MTENVSRPTVLVTGAAGYIGSHVVGELYHKGYRVIALDNLSNGYKESLNPNILFFHTDIRDLASLRKIFMKHNVSKVIHLAALAIVEESFLRENDYKETNIEGTRNIVLCCEEFGVRDIIFSSSSTVYGDVNGQRNLTEEDSLQPINPYGHTKRVCEDLIRQSYLNSIILRYFNVAGAKSDLTNGPRGKGSQRLFFHLAQAALSGTSFTINGDDYPTDDGTCVRDYIHIEDLVDIHMSCLHHLESAAKTETETRWTLNCGYEKGYSVAKAAQSFQLYNQVNVSIVKGPRRAGDPIYLVGDTTQLKQKLNWKSRFEDPLKEICISTYQWMKKQKG